MNEKVIYFSLNEERRKSFYQFVGDEICYTQKFSFSLEGDNRCGRGPNSFGAGVGADAGQHEGDNSYMKDHSNVHNSVQTPLFKDPRDLIPLIENCKKKDSLHVIIDYVSCCSFEKIDNYAEVIRDIIMAYPEVQFLFDETFVLKETPTTSTDKWCFLNFLFKDATIKNGEVKCKNEAISVLTDFHQFSFGELHNEEIEKQLICLLKGRNNMFDGSNLRCAIRTYKLVNKLKVRDNFFKLTKSRRDHLAIVVEEEYQQSIFNGYCLYTNGFRAIPIMTATELKWINKKENEEFIKVGNDKNDPKTIVVRDYDLQFIDERKCLTEDKPKVKTKGGNEVEEINEIDLVRGAKYCAEIKKEETNAWTKGKSKDVRKYEEDFALVPIKHNPYWKAFQHTPTFFVSKGGGNLITRKCVKMKKRPMHLSHKTKKLVLYGIQKPIEGIYVSMQKFKPVRKRYKKTVYGFLRKKENGVNIYRIDIKRQEVGGHGCPLDIYGIVRSMVNRAELYYRFGRPRLAALVAGEALEILNGFHMSLMKQAYYIKAVSENAMAMSLLGGDEALLCEDLIFRMKKVRKEVNRLVQDIDDRENLLMNIYNDCRLFCREKEYLVAADDALSYMMRDREGWNLISKIINLLS